MLFFLSVICHLCFWARVIVPARVSHVCVCVCEIAAVVNNGRTVGVCVFMAVSESTPRWGLTLRHERIRSGPI